MIQNIDTDLLEQKYMRYWLRAYFRKMKNGNIVTIDNSTDETEPRYMFGSESFETISGQISIKIISQKNYSLKVKGFFIKPFYEGLSLVARFNDQEIKATLCPSKHNNNEVFLGREIFPAYDFEFDLSIQDIAINQTFSLEFYFVYLGKYYVARMKQRWFSRFYYQNEFFIGDNCIVYNRGESHEFQIERLNKLYHINQLVRDKRDSFADPHLINKVIENFDAYRKKRIWLFIDRHNRIDDNAEALFRYCCNINDDIEKFMVVPNSSYYENFVGVNPNIITYGSFEYKFLIIFAEKYISSTTFYDSNVDTNIPKHQFRKIVDTFSNFDEIFLRHGVTQNTGIFDKYLNNTRRNFSMLCLLQCKSIEVLLLFPDLLKNK